MPLLQPEVVTCKSPRVASQRTISSNRTNHPCDNQHIITTLLLSSLVDEEPATSWERIYPHRSRKIRAKTPPRRTQSPSSRKASAPKPIGLQRPEPKPESRPASSLDLSALEPGTGHMAEEVVVVMNCRWEARMTSSCRIEHERTERNRAANGALLLFRLANEYHLPQSQCSKLGGRYKVIAPPVDGSQPRYRFCCLRAPRRLERQFDTLFSSVRRSRVLVPLLSIRSTRGAVYLLGGGEISGNDSMKRNVVC